MLLNLIHDKIKAPPVRKMRKLIGEITKTKDAMTLKQKFRKVLDLLKFQSE